MGNHRKLDVDASQGELVLWYEKQSGMIIKYIVLPQQDHLKDPPLTISKSGINYILIRNKWSNQKAKLGWTRLGGYIPGYQYALYKLKDRGKSKHS